MAERLMKDSRVTWIGQIPANWNVCRLKNVANLYTGNSIKDELKGNYEDSTNAHPYISSKDIDADLQIIDYNNGMYVKDADESFEIAKEGDTLMCIEGGSAGRKKAILNQKVSFVNKLCCFSPNDIEAKYLYYYLMSPGFEKEFNKYISGLIGGVSVSILKNFCIQQPSKNEQARIVDFLDKKVSEIDALISKTNESIEEYKKLKQSIITEAVTKGLDSNIEMKDSENEWIGEIPIHWDIVKIKQVSSVVTDGAHISPETENGLYEFVSIVDIKGNKIDFDSCLKTSEKNYNYLVSTGCQPKKYDVLLSKDGSVGKTIVVNEDREFVVSSSLVIIRPIQSLINSFYLNYYLQSDPIQKTLQLLMHGTGLKRVSVEKNANLRIVLPSLSEQKSIVEYLDNRCSKYDFLISKKEQVITELEQYKKSLIYEYVTGKKEVCYD